MAGDPNSGRRNELAELVARIIHNRMAGEARTVSSFDDDVHPDVCYARMTAYDILDELKSSGWEIVKKPGVPEKS